MAFNKSHVDSFSHDYELNVKCKCGRTTCHTIRVYDGIPGMAGPPGPMGPAAPGILKLVSNSGDIGDGQVVYNVPAYTDLSYSDTFVVGAAGAISTSAKEKTNNPTRMYFAPSNGALCAGTANSTQWDSPGSNSTALGSNNTAAGPTAFVTGSGNTVDSTSTNCAIIGGSGNTISSTAEDSHISGGTFNQLLGTTSCMIESSDNCEIINTGQSAIFASSHCHIQGVPNVVAMGIMGDSVANPFVIDSSSVNGPTLVTTSMQFSGGFQTQGYHIPSAGIYLVGSLDYIIYCDTTVTTKIQLPSSNSPNPPINGQRIIIKDITEINHGSGTYKPITISPSSPAHLTDGASDLTSSGYTLQNAGESVELQYTINVISLGAAWLIINPIPS